MRRKSFSLFVKNTTIPQKTVSLAKKILKSARIAKWDDVTEFPSTAIEIVTDGNRGKYKPGIKGWIVGGMEREIFIGSDKAGKEITLHGVKIPEFTILLENGSQFLGQYGRDFKFVEEDN